MSDPGRYSDVTLYRRLLLQARPYWVHIAAIFGVSLLATPLALLAPVPLKLAVDNVLGDQPLPGILHAILPDRIEHSTTGALVIIAGLVVLIALLKQLQELGSSFIRTYAGEKLLLGFRSQLFRHVQRLSLAYHDTKGTANSTYRIQYDAAAIQEIAIDGVIPFITAGVTLGAMIYVTARIDQQLALVAMAICPLLFLVTRVYRGRLREQSREVKQLESAALSVIQEVLSAVRVVKAFGQEEREEGRFFRESSAGVRARMRLVVLEGAFGLLIGVLTAIGMSAVLYIGVRRVQLGEITLGDLLLVMGYLTQLYEPLKTMSKRVTKLQSSLASAERAFSVLDESPDVPERPGARALARATGNVCFRNVSFAYGEQPVLRDLCFDVAAGSRVGIIGATGAGKTTLVSLLTRFYDPTEGEISLDGIDLRDYRLADLRNQFAIVLQEPVLFSTSIAENIAYARPEASESEIVEAAKAANAHEFIIRLPDGYETPVGERGMRLSGGERQRIALARAFLKDASILILDEPTSSVDIKTEAVIMSAMNRLSQGRTTFMIAHRLSTLNDCDMTVEIQHGMLIEKNGSESAAAESASVAGAQQWFERLSESIHTYANWSKK